MTRLVIVPEMVDVMNNRVPVKELTSNDVLLFTDSFSRARLDSALCFGNPGMILCDTEGTDKPLPIPYCFSATYAFEYQNLRMTDYQFNDVDVTECFNFSIAKQRPERHLLLKLVEWFSLSSYRYSWSEFERYFNMDHFLTEMASLDQPWMTNELKIHMLGPVNWFEKRWTQNNERIENSGEMFVGGTMEWIWENVQQQLVPQTAVTMITESGTDFEDNYTFTEKTGFAILGKTFPIWIGSYKQASQAERMGFDVFSDIIDHSYQHCETMFERCYRAVADNLEILTNLELAKKLKLQHNTRLTNNRDHLLKGGVSSWITQELNMLPRDVRDYINTIYSRKVK